MLTLNRIMTCIHNLNSKFIIIISVMEFICMSHFLQFNRGTYVIDTDLANPVCFRGIHTLLQLVLGEFLLESFLYCLIWSILVLFWSHIIKGLCVFHFYFLIFISWCWDQHNSACSELKVNDIGCVWSWISAGKVTE